MDMVVDAKRSDDPPTFERLADNQLRVELAFAGLTGAFSQHALVNLTDFWTLSLTGLTSPQCWFAFVDLVVIEELIVELNDFNVYFPQSFGRDPNTCRSGVQCSIGAAIDTLRTEQQLNNQVVPPGQSLPTAMINMALKTLTDVRSLFDWILNCILLTL
jgi:hypothetical protein